MFLRRSPIWPDPRVKPPFGSVGFDREHPLAPDVGCWLFNEGAGPPNNLAKPISTSLVGAPVWVPSLRMSAVDFPTSSDYIDGGGGLFSPFDVITSQMTLAVWIRKDVANQDAGVVGKYNTGPTGSFLVYLGADATNATWSFEVTQSNTTAKFLNTPNTVAANTDAFLVGVADGSNLRTYRDGLATGDVLAYDGTIQVSIQRVVMGRLRATDTLYPFNGQISAAYLYSRGLASNLVFQLNDAPYSFLVPIIRRRYFLPSAPTAANGDGVLHRRLARSRLLPLPLATPTTH